jgi:Fe-S oxidoreductase
MGDLIFDRDTCLNCETLDCLVRCRYLGLDPESAGKEKMKILGGEDSAVLHECVTCYACEEYCPNNNHPFFQIVELQEKRGIYTAPRPITHQQIKWYSLKGDNDLGGSLESPAVSLCLFPDMEEKIQGDIFEGASPFLGRDFFCNLVYLHFAKMSLIKERLPRVIENIQKNLEKNGLEELVCFHDECYAGFTHWAKAYGVEVPFRSIHLYGFLAQRLRALEGKTRPLHKKVAYQRPCSNRLIPETQRFVDEVFELIGAERVPRAYDRETALCCGSILFMQGRDDLAEELQEKNIRDMVEAGAEYCVFNCPMCLYTLGEAVSKAGITPVMMPDLCETALGERHDGRRNL